MSGDQILAIEPGCHLSVGDCGFPAPGSEIFFFDDIAKFTLGSTEFAVTKPMILLWIAAILTLYTGYDYFRAGSKHLVE